MSFQQTSVEELCGSEAVVLDIVENPVALFFACDRVGLRLFLQSTKPLSRRSCLSLWSRSRLSCVVLHAQGIPCSSEGDCKPSKTHIYSSVPGGIGRVL